MIRTRIAIATAIALTLLAASCGGDGAGATAGRPTATTPPVTPSVTPSVTASPSTTGPMGTILFSLEYGEDGADGSELVTVHPDGTGFTTVADFRPSLASHPAWSPDHQSILFDLEAKNTSAHIYSIPAVGGKVTQLTHGEAYDYCPTASPDGRHIAFARSEPPGSATAIYVMSANGTHVTRLTTATGEGDWQPEYSPDGTRLLFGRNGALDVVRSDGSGLTEVVGPKAQVESPHWSPDGRSIVYHDAKLGTRTVSLDGGRPATVLDSVGDANWSPDGTLIVGNYLDMSLPAFWLATMKPDGSGLTPFWHPEVAKDIWPNFPTWAADQ